MLNENWTLCDKRACREPIVQLRHGDALWIKTGLQGYNSDPVRMAAFRHLLFSHGQDWAVSRISDWEVIDQIAQLLLTDRLHLHAKTVKPVPWVSPGEATSSSGPAAAGRSSSSPRGRSSAAGSSYTVPDLPTFAVQVDGATQAAALMAAASLGQPFCPQ